MDLTLTRQTLNLMNFIFLQLISFQATTKFSTNQTIIIEIIPIIDKLHHEAQILLEFKNESEADFAGNINSQLLEVLNYIFLAGKPIIFLEYY